MQQDMQDKAKLRERLLEAEQSLLVISKQQETEIDQIRGQVNDRQGNENVNQVKQNEKNSALFTEVVRLGEE